MLGEVEGALTRLARVDIRDEGVMVELEAIDQALIRIRALLHGHRWI